MRTPDALSVRRIDGPIGIDRKWRPFPARVASLALSHPEIIPMRRKSIGRLCCLSMALAWIGAGVGCSDNSVTPIDTKSVIQKASGGEGQARQSAKAKEASEEAAKTHPKIH